MLAVKHPMPLYHDFVADHMRMRLHSVAMATGTTIGSLQQDVRTIQTFHKA